MDGRPIEVADADDGRLEEGEVLEVGGVGGEIVDGFAGPVEALDLCFCDADDAEAALHDDKRSRFRRLIVEVWDEVSGVPTGAVALSLQKE